MAVTAVLFDLWETLIQDTPERAQPRREWRSRAVQDVLQLHGTQVPLTAVQAALDASSHALVRLHDQGMDLSKGGRAELFLSNLRDLSSVTPPHGARDELEGVITAMPLEIAPVLAPYAVETATLIKHQGLATALVCNAGFTTTPHLLPMLAHYGLSPHLDAMVFSDELGFAKPDPRIFAKALADIGVSAANSIFVGDNPHTDIAGAQAAGMFAVQVGDKERDGVTPDGRIADLSGLPDVLRQLA